MRTITLLQLTVGCSVLGLAMFCGCATPAIVFVSPEYQTRHIQSVTVQGFSDAPGQAGSGVTMSDIFEKYLFNLQYQVIDPNQGHADAAITGSISEMTALSEQTVMVDVPQEETEPVYQDVTFQTRRGGLRTVTEQTGTQTVVTDQAVPETETLPARVGLSVRLVAAKDGALLWSGSGSADGMTIEAAAEAASSKITEALQKSIASQNKPK